MQQRSRFVSKKSERERKTWGGKTGTMTGTVGGECIIRHQ